MVFGIEGVKNSISFCTHFISSPVFSHMDFLPCCTQSPETLAGTVVFPRLMMCFVIENELV